MTLTKSWLQKQITDLEATRDEIPFGLDEDGNNTLAALKLALAVMGAEPVGYMNRFTGRVFTLEEQPGADTDVQVYVPVYTAPPAPASVPDEVNAEDCPAFVKYDVSEVDEAWARGFNACRASMLQAGNSPVIPDGWVLVPVEPTEEMIIQGFESEPDESFSEEKDWLTYEAMSGCQQAAHRAQLCWAAMISAAPHQEVKP